MASSDHNDPFEILGLPRRFEIDPGALRRAWLAASAAAHPDRHGGDTLEDADTLRRSALLNDAKRTLEDPELRAEALLGLLGGPGKGDDKSLPDGFLMEMMSVREDLEASAGDPARVAELERWAQEQRQGHVARIAGLFAEHERTGEGVALASIRLELNAWRYIERMLEQVHPARGAHAR